MNNIVEYSDITAIHPGYYIAEIIEDMGITQTEFAARMGTSNKTISNLINGQIGLSNDLIKKLSIMLDISVDFWLNIQSAYEEKMIQIEQAKDYDEQARIASLIDYKYFVRIANLPDSKNTIDRVKALCKYFVIADLKVLSQPDFLASYRSGINSSTISEKNTINARAWLQTALNFAKNIKTAPFDAEKLKNHLPEIRAMTVQNPTYFLPKLDQIFRSCGVAFVLLPHLKNSGINGVVKWINAEQVVLAINDRRAYADTFWFSLFHEIKHVLQQKTKTVFLSASSREMQEMDDRLEKEADDFAKNYLIPPKEYRRFNPNQYTSDIQIIKFAESIGIHPGVVAGRLQHDGIIAANRCATLKEKYQIVLPS